jgi:hypothetical protein
LQVVVVVVVLYISVVKAAPRSLELTFRSRSVEMTGMLA